MLAEKRFKIIYFGAQHFHTTASFNVLFPGLAGKTELEKARADMIVDCSEDVTRELTKLFVEKDEAKKVCLIAT